MVRHLLSVPKGLIYACAALCFPIAFFLFARCATSTGAACIAMASAIVTVTLLWALRFYIARRGWFKDEDRCSYQHPPRRRSILSLIFLGALPSAALLLHFIIMAANTGCFGGMKFG